MKQPFCAPSEALRRVLDAAAALPRPAAETLPLDDAVGRIAAEPLSARMDQPPFDRSPLDATPCTAPTPPGPAAKLLSPCRWS